MQNLIILPSTLVKYGSNESKSSATSSQTIGLESNYEVIDLTSSHQADLRSNDIPVEYQDDEELPSTWLDSTDVVSKNCIFKPATFQHSLV